jgi:hypothetical protein
MRKITRGRQFSSRKNAFAFHGCQQTLTTKLKRKDNPLPGSPVIDLSKHLQQTLRKQPEQTLNCISCRLIITSPTEGIEVNGKHRHIFTNPHGYSFTIGCFAQADGVAVTGESSDFWSWFAGYQWQIVLCRQCRLHLGWRFSSASQLYGLNLNRLISVDRT